VGPGPAESAMGPIKKMPHRGDIQVRPPYRGAPGWILRPSGVRRTNSSSRSRRSGPVELQRGRGRLVRQTRNASGDVISMSHRSGLGLETHPLTVLSKTTWTTCCEALRSCLNVLDALWRCDRPCHFQANNCCRSGGQPIIPPSRTNAANRKRNISGLQ
jgi:hypothetical protein